MKPKESQQSVSQDETKLFAIRDSVFVPTYTSNHYLDEEELATESIRLGELLNKRFNAISLDKKFVPNPIEKKLFGEADTIQATAIQLDANLDREINRRMGSLSHSQLAFIHARRVGIASTIHNAFETQNRIAEHYGSGTFLKPYTQLKTFIAAGELSIKIGEISFKDFVSDENFSRVSEPAAFQFLVDSLMLRATGGFDRVFDWNDDKLIHDYPNTAKNKADVTTAMVWGLLSCHPQDIVRFISRTKGIEKDSAQLSLQIQDRIWSVKQRFYQSISDPNSGQFSSMKEKLEQYIQQGDVSAATALHLAGLDITDNVYDLYRKSRIFAQEGIHKEYFGTLAEVIKNFIQTVPDELGILTDDDFQLIIDPSHRIGEDSNPDFDSMGEKITRIRLKSPIRDYTVDPKVISGRGIVEPQSVQLELDKVNPNGFFLELSFGNENGENMQVIAFIDAEERAFNWSFLDSPNDFPDIRNSILLSGQSVLNTVLSQLEENIQSNLQTNKDKRERNNDAIYQIRKQAKAERRERKQQSPFELAIAASLTQKREIVHTIVIPNKEALNQLMGKLSTVDQQIVQESIAAFNSRGVGQFKMLVQEGMNGKPLYVLRINCSVRGGIRVLMSEIPHDTNRERRFSISDIDYRKDIYRKNNL